MLADGRTAEVSATAKGRVLKLDRPDWNGPSAFAEAVLADLADGGDCRCPGHAASITLDERYGVILDRVETGSGPRKRERAAGGIFSLKLINELVDSLRNIPRC